MTQARRTLISLADTPYYHCITRCVRRAFLCGKNFETHQNFDHRKVWLVERFKYLSSIFAIDICAYAVMSNHYHLVLYVDQHRVENWSDEEVLDRWGKLFNVSVNNLINQLTCIQSPVAKDVFRQKIEQWRNNLRDISWFMKCLNEYMARRCNGVDNCKGHFWEARFKSQALLDEKALLACMTYVDLNPVRAGMAETPETSDFTSIQERIVDHAKRINKAKRSARQDKLLAHYKKYYEKQRISWKRGGQNTAGLMPFGGSLHVPLNIALPFTRQEYFELTDYTGRAVRKDKRGAIPKELPGLLVRMGFEEQGWLECVREFMDRYGVAAGDLVKLRCYEERNNLRGMKGIGMAQKLNSYISV